MTPTITKMIMKKQLKASSCNGFFAILSEASNAVGATIHVRRQ